MKGYLAVMLIAVAGVALGQQATKAPEAPKITIAIIDVDTLIGESGAGRQANARLQKLTEEKMAQARKMTDEHDALAKEIQAKAATLTDTKLAELRNQLEDKEVAMKHFDDDAKTQLTEAKRKEQEALNKLIMPIVQELGREMKVQLIFDKWHSGLLYADVAVDITDQVLKRFNTQVTK
jgi:outer membrane protein